MKPEIGEARFHKKSHNNGNYTRPGFALAEVRSPSFSSPEDPSEPLAAQNRRHPARNRRTTWIFTGAWLLDDSGWAGTAGRGLAMGAALVAKADQLVGAAGTRIAPQGAERGTAPNNRT